MPETGAEGVIVANADHIGGFALWVDEAGILHHTYSFLGVETYRQTATQPLPTGDVSVRMLFEADEAKPGTGGRVTLWAGTPRSARADTAHGPGRVLQLRRHGHQPRQRPGRRPRLRGPGPVRLHGHGPQVVFDLKPAPIEDEAELHRTASQAGMAHGAAG